MASGSTRVKAEAPTGAVGVLYGLTMFLSAFLVFQVQPVIAKFILPWYGGSASVWTVCMLFFQGCLLLGYLYAHLLTRTFTVRLQAVIHGVLLAASLALLPIVPADAWKPTASTEPVWGILTLLGASLAGPTAQALATDCSDFPGACVQGFKMTR